jgi:hypothetical protein
MNDSLLAVAALVVIFGGALMGVFLTKKAGFGRFSSSLVVLLLVVFSASVFAATGRLQPADLANILFAVAGFAGGLITARSDGA